VKKLILSTLILIGIITSAQADSHCSSTLAGWKSSDAMVNSYKITGSETIIWVNNIRNFKAIDIADYGFTQFQATKLESKYGCKNVSFREAYDKYGIPLI